MFLFCYGREKALLEVILHERSENGEIETYEYKLTGHFSSAGTVSAAEGTIIQVSFQILPVNNPITTMTFSIRMCCKFPPK